jgi:hypothetical protein
MMRRSARYFPVTPTSCPYPTATIIKYEYLMSSGINQITIRTMTEDSCSMSDEIRTVLSLTGARLLFWRLP